MKGIYEWVRSLVSFMILMTVIMNLLPDKKYEKYLQLFTGMVFLLLFFAPLTDLSGLEAQMVGAFERITFQTDAKLLKKEIEDADEARMQKLILQYEAVLEQELRTMAEAVEADCDEVVLVMETDLEQAEFGRLREVTMVFRLEEQTEAEQIWAVNRAISELRMQIGEYYGMEERDITLVVEAE